MKNNSNVSSTVNMLLSFRHLEFKTCQLLCLWAQRNVPCSNQSGSVTPQYLVIQTLFSDRCKFNFQLIWRNLQWWFPTLRSDSNFEYSYAPWWTISWISLMQNGILRLESWVKMVDVLLCSTYEDQKRDFVFDFKDSGKLQRLTVPIPIPLKVDAREFVQRLITFHNLPCYLEPGTVWKETMCGGRRGTGWGYWHACRTG